MSVSDADEEHVGDLLLRDVAATVGVGYEEQIRTAADGQPLARLGELASL